MNDDTTTEPASCTTCGATLSPEVSRAAALLYGGAVLDPAQLAAAIGAGLRENRYGGDAGPDHGNTLGEQTLWGWLGFAVCWPEALVAAVRHYDGGGCQLGQDALVPDDDRPAPTLETASAALSAEEAAWAALAPPALTPEQERLVEALVIAVHARIVERLAALLPGVGPAIRELAEPALTG